MRQAIILLLCLSMWASAEDLYVAQTAAGADDGTSCANSKGATWFNSSGNWGVGAGKISAGDTVHLCGTFGPGGLTAQASGSAGSPITIQFETGAMLSSIRWTNAALTLSGLNYLTIIGTLGTPNIQCTSNGTAQALQGEATAIIGQVCNNLIIRNMTITNLYNRTEGTGDGNRYGQGLNLYGSDITVQGCALSDGDTMIGVDWSTGTTSNLFLLQNTITRCNHAITIGNSATNAHLINVIITSNRIDNLKVWDGNEGIHLDGMIIFDESPIYDGYISNMLISANWIGPYIGLTNNTAAIYLDCYTPTNFLAVKIYNNLFTTVSPYRWNDLCVSGGGDILCAANTFIGYNSSSGAIEAVNANTNTGPFKLFNNLLDNCGGQVTFGRATSVGPGFACDYNVYSRLPSGTFPFQVTNFRNQDWSGWTNGIAGDILQYVDAHTTTNTVSLDSNYIPSLADTVARGQGTNLTAFGITNDFYGNARPASGPWTIGAFEYAAAVIGTNTARLFGPAQIFGPARLQFNNP